jgi:hypothetical protein
MKAFRAFLVSVLVLPAAAVAQPLPRPTPVDLALVLAVDVSGSVDEEEARLQRKGYVDALSDPAIVSAITSGILRRAAVTYFEWAGDRWQVPVVDWKLIDGQESADAFANELAAAPIGGGPWTSISSAIDFAVALHEASPYEATRRVIDISGDGPNNTGSLVASSRDEAVAKRITINGLAIMNDRQNFGRTPMPNLDLYYRHCVIGGHGSFVVVANGFKDFGRAIRRKLSLEIAGLQPADRSAGPVLSDGRVQSPPTGPGGKRWIPPCDEGERRFRGVIDDE